MTLLPLLDLPGRDEAREAAREELSRNAYQEARPPLVVRVGEWVVEELQDLLDRASQEVPGGGWGLLLLSLVLLVLGVALFVRLRPSVGSTRPLELFEGSVSLRAADHRSRAEAAEAAGDLETAVAERFRAVVRELEERGVLDPRPGRTADEVAGEAGRAVPAIAVPLAEGARLFDAVRYGGKPAEPATCRSLAALDERVRSSQLVLA